MQEKLLKAKDLKEFLKISESLLRRLIRENKIPFMKVGGAIRFSIEEIQKWLKEKEIPEKS